MSKDKTATTVWLDYKGKAGSNGEFDHDGEIAFARPGGGDPLGLQPGLNKIDGATFAPFVEHGSIKLRLEAKQIVMTDEKLRGYETPAALRDLAQRTQSANALEHMLTLERAKPIAGAPRERQNQQIVELLEGRLGRFKRRPAINLVGLHAQATQAATAATPAKAAG